MQLDDSNIHKLFAIKTLRHTNTSSIKTTIFYIMKTSHNLNHAIYATHADVLLLNYWIELLLGCCWVTACFMLYATCSMLCAWPVNIALLYHADKSYFSKHFNISSKTCNTLYYILKLSLIYSTYSWFGFIKQHIYFAIL